MITLTYLLGYAAVVLCLIMALTRIKRYTARPMHIRWELYPVPHEGARAAWGGSYLENSDWWKKSRTHSLLGMAKGLAQEMLLLHLTYENNRDLWYRTYPFHGGIYLCFASFGLTFVGAIMGLCGIFDGGLYAAVESLANLCTLIGKLAILVGACLLLQRRLSDKGLRQFSTPEHYFNLLIFAGWALFGLVAYVTTPSYFVIVRDFLMNFLTFHLGNPMPGTNPLPNAGYIFLTLYTFALMIIVPATHMSHLFMKYFTWHNIRWDDTPTLDDKTINENIGQNLGRKPTWSASHIQGDGKKTWADIALTNPTSEEKSE